MSSSNIRNTTNLILKNSLIKSKPILNKENELKSSKATTPILNNELQLIIKDKNNLNKNLKPEVPKNTIVFSNIRKLKVENGSNTDMDYFSEFIKEIKDKGDKGEVKKDNLEYKGK